jgi:hypothetical protein
MPDLQNYDLDLRNWNARFQMGDLKKALRMIRKDGANHMSINSKNISKNNKGAQQNKEEANRNSLYKDEEEEDQVDFAPHFMM